MKKYAAMMILALGMVSGASQANSWEFDEKSQLGERCQCTWSFDN